MRHSERILEIHKEYIKAGANLIRTNSFASNFATLFMEEQELTREEKLQELGANVRAAVKIAGQAVEACADVTLWTEQIAEKKRGILIAGDIGPIPETGLEEYEELLEEYYTIADALLEENPHIIWFETFADFQYILPVAKYIKAKKDIFIMASFCLNKFGYTRAGISGKSILQKVEECQEIDGVGFNCGIGSTHMYRILKDIELGECIVSVMPNSGYPDIINDRTGYQENTAYFCENMKEIAELGVNILGGCCGTTPEYIRQLNQKFEQSTCGQWEKAKEQQTNVRMREEAIPGSRRNETTEDIIKKEKNEFYCKLQGEKKVVIVELDPPHDGNCEKIIQASLLLKEAGADMVTFSDSPMGKMRADSIMTGAKIQREIEIPVMPHVTCRDKNRIGMGAAFFGAHMNGIRNLLLITGDPVPGGDRSGVKPVFDFNSMKLMEYVRQMNHEYFKDDPIVYGGALNYGRANLEKEIERMQRKCDAGADYFLTQPIFAGEDVEKIAYIKQKINTKILCGIMPLVSYRNANFMKNEVFGIHVPDEIVARYHKDMSRQQGEETGIDIALEIAEQLRDIADGYYFMVPFNRASMICSIMKRMKEKCLI